MKRILLVGFITFILTIPALAQKRSTILGDAWTGEVVTTSDSTREISIKYADAGETKTFVGFLEEGYKVKMKDGRLQELKVSEITPGTRIRVFYKTKQQDVGGRKAKAHKIFRIDFLGVDEHERLRELLNLAPSTPVTLAESENLPTTNPLKLYLAIEYRHVKDNFVDWLNKWNREQAAKYGALEIVSEPSQADISLVIYRGADKLIVPIPLEAYDAAGTLHKFSHVTAYMVKGDKGLKVMWMQVLLIDLEKPESPKGRIEKEFEKRMKARYRS